MRTITIGLLISLLLAGASVATAQQQTMRATSSGMIFATVPPKIDPGARYLFYLSGYIVEAGNRRPTSPKFGVYEYDEILKAFAREGFVVISEARIKNPEIEPYALNVTKQITQLLKAGVPASHITVVGASQGSWIEMLVSTYLRNRNVRFVLIAACSANKEFLNRVDLHGAVLSVFEKSDLAQSCEQFRTDATGISEWGEVALKTGLKHGFIYRPMTEWMAPTIAWARR